MITDLYGDALDGAKLRSAISFRLSSELRFH